MADNKTLTPQHILKYEEYQKKQEEYSIQLQTLQAAHEKYNAQLIELVAAMGEDNIKLQTLARKRETCSAELKELKQRSESINPISHFYSVCMSEIACHNKIIAQTDAEIVSITRDRKVKDNKENVLTECINSVRKNMDYTAQCIDGTTEKRMHRAAETDVGTSDALAEQYGTKPLADRDRGTMSGLFYHPSKHKLIHQYQEEGVASTSLHATATFELAKSGGTYAMGISTNNVQVLERHSSDGIVGLGSAQNYSSQLSGSTHSEQEDQDQEQLGGLTMTVGAGAGTHSLQ